MTTKALEQREAALEAEVARLKEGRTEEDPPPIPWWEQIRGRFKDDPAYDEAMRYGRKYRASQRVDDLLEDDAQ